jgi:hypothetical protein
MPERAADQVPGRAAFKLLVQLPHGKQSSIASTTPSREHAITLYAHGYCGEACMIIFSVVTNSHIFVYPLGSTTYMADAVWLLRTTSSLPRLLFDIPLCSALLALPPLQIILHKGRPGLLCLRFCFCHNQLCRCYRLLSAIAGFAAIADYFVVTHTDFV